MYISRAPQAAIPATALGQNLATKWGASLQIQSREFLGKVHAGMGFGPVRWALGNKYMAPFCCQVLAKRGGGNRRLRRSGYPSRQQQINQTSIQNHSTFGPKWIKHASKINQTSSKHRSNIYQNWTKFRSWVLLWLLGCLGGVLGASWERFGTVLSGSWVPTWVPKWSQLEQKIDPKINHFLDASWNRFLVGFWWILGAKMEPSWHQHGIKN